MREYQPIWNRIKTTNSASIVASPELHRRIIKAVIKEKYMDTAYKKELADKSLKSELVITKDKDDKCKIHFSLIIKFDPKLARVENL